MAYIVAADLPTGCRTYIIDSEEVTEDQLHAECMAYSSEVEEYELALCDEWNPAAHGFGRCY